MPYQLWQLLINVKQLQPGESLTCSDCFAILDLLLLGAEPGFDFNRLQQLARERLQDRLDHLENQNH